MKKKLITILMGLMLSAGLIGGCGQTNNSSESVKQEETAEGKEVTGTIDEIKDFMFVVTDNVSNGDTVTVKYTGTVSEVDPFEGEVISVEKTK